jgi:hypothetical protein
LLVLAEGLTKIIIYKLTWLEVQSTKGPRVEATVASRVSQSIADFERRYSSWDGIVNLGVGIVLWEGGLCVNQMDGGGEEELEYGSARCCVKRV